MRPSGSDHPMFKHGCSKRGIGASTYKTWLKMKERCTNPKADQWEWYGGKGITVCERWLNSFENFLDDMGLRPVGCTLDRKESNGNYELDNCRWADKVTQARNASHVIFLEVDGRKAPLRQFADENGIHWNIIYQRVRAGWPHERAVKTPAQIKRRPS